ncbi:MAG: fatty acid desaturase [Rickettsiaceae bacterium]|nr:fatty acid desaturase [Rickettsiaceae bacterium]
MFKNVNWPAFIILIPYPIFLIILGVKYLQNYDAGWFELGIFFAGYYISNITVGIGLHRLWAHGAYKTNKFVEFVLTMLSAGTLQGPALSWVSNHFKHHSYTDTKQDPHTPLKFKSRVKGFLWSHIGWMILNEGSYKSIDRVTMVKLGKNRLLRWQLKYYWQLALLMNTIFPALIGGILGIIYGREFLPSAFTGFLFIGLGRALQQEITFFVNSLCHFMGTKEYTKGTAGDIWWLAFFLLGENWHNFHHAFPSDYRNGHKWYQTDVHKWIIYMMSKLGMAWDLKITASNRIEAKVSQTIELIKKSRQQKFEILQNRLNELVKTLQEKFNELEDSSNLIKDKMQKSYIKAQNNLANLKDQLNQQLKKQQLKNFQTPSSEKIIKIISAKIKETEIYLQNMYQEVDKLRIQL